MTGSAETLRRIAAELAAGMPLDAADLEAVVDGLHVAAAAIDRQRQQREPADALLELAELIGQTTERGTAKAITALADTYDRKHWRRRDKLATVNPHSPAVKEHWLYVMFRSGWKLDAESIRHRLRRARAGGSVAAHQRTADLAAHVDAPQGDPGDHARLEDHTAGGSVRGIRQG